MGRSVVRDTSSYGGGDEGNVTKGVEGWEWGHLADSSRTTSVALVTAK